MTARFFKLSLIVSTISFSFLAHADDYYNAHPGKGWSIGAGINYLQFSNNGTSFAEDFNERVYNINPKYDVGYDIYAGYHVPTKDSDLKLDYSHLHNSDSKSVSTELNNPLTVFNGEYTLGPLETVKATNTFDYDSVNFTAGHTLKLLPTFDLTLGAGINYTHIKRNMHTVGSGLGNIIDVEGGTNFSGWGPVFELDGGCHPLPQYPTFSVHGGVQTEFAYGSMSSFLHSDDNGFFDRVRFPNIQTLVPGVGAKIDLDYDVPMQNYLLNTQLGWKFNTYFGATKDNSYSGSESNMSFEGPYFMAGFRF